MGQREFHGADRRLVFALDGDLHAHVFDLRVVEDFFQVVHRRVRYVVGFEPLDPVRTRLFFEKHREGLVKLVVVIAPVRPGLKSWIFDQLRMLDRFAQPIPEFLG